MGGGDLNLKKSWHPHTMKNQEKVWKAQQAKNQEERKMNDLRKEIEDEKSREDLKRHGESSGVLAKGDNDKKLEWMYKSSTDLINRDEYLTGRKIDKSFETLQAEEKQRDQNMVGVKQSINHVDHECVPFSIRSYRNVESTEQVDLQRKVMEDPLMLIKQREMESRRKLLENPVKLKELHRILKTDQMLQKAKRNKKEKKAKKSKKKHKKRARSSSSSSSSTSTNSDSDQDLDKKLEKKLKGSNLISKEEKLVGLNITKLLDAKYETLSKELDKAAHSKSTNKSKERRGRSSSANSESSTERNRDQHRRQDGRQSNDRSRNRPYRQQYERRGYRSRSRSQNQRNPVRNRSHDRRRSPQTERRRPRKRSESPESRRQVKRTPPPRANREYNKNSKLTEEEKEARRREMMENAAWRETDRTKSVQKHRDAYAREEQQNRARDFDKNFINKEVKKAIANQNSVESRIRSNLNNIQRTSAAMNSNFTRKY